MGLSGHFPRHDFEGLFDFAQHLDDGLSLRQTRTALPLHQTGKKLPD
jgi:hypothetical protein